MSEVFVWSHAGRDYPVPYQIVGHGKRSMLLLPALSSVAARREMEPLAERLAGAEYRCWIPDWPGFGDQPRLSLKLAPATLQAFLDAFIDGPLAGSTLIGIGAGHAATYLLAAAARHPRRFTALALVAPTWRGPLPTAMGPSRRPLYRRIRQAIEAPVVGPLLYAANVSQPIVRKMLREHVYADPGFITAERLAAKMSVTRQPRARFATAAFVTGALDPVDRREAFLALFSAPDLPPVLLVRPRDAPAKSGAEMDSVAAAGLATTITVAGALAAHEEQPEAVAAAFGSFLAANVAKAAE